MPLPRPRRASATKRVPHSPRRRRRPAWRPSTLSSPVAKPLSHDGKDYAPGETVSLGAAAAAHLLATGVVAEPAFEPEGKGKGKAGDAD